MGGDADAPRRGECWDGCRAHTPCGASPGRTSGVAAAGAGDLRELIEGAFGVPPLAFAPAVTVPVLGGVVIPVACDVL